MYLWIIFYLNNFFLVFLKYICILSGMGGQKNNVI